jgi:hypothetical protein
MVLKTETLEVRSISNIKKKHRILEIYDFKTIKF